MLKPQKRRGPRPYLGVCYFDTQDHSGADDVSMGRAVEQALDRFFKYIGWPEGEDKRVDIPADNLKSAQRRCGVSRKKWDEKSKWDEDLEGLADAFSRSMRGILFDHLRDLPVYPDVKEDIGREIEHFVGELKSLVPRIQDDEARETKDKVLEDVQSELSQMPDEIVRRIRDR